MKTKHLHLHVFVRIGDVKNRLGGLWRCDCGVESSLMRRHGHYVGRDSKVSRARYPDLVIPWDVWSKEKIKRTTMWWVWAARGEKGIRRA